MNSSTARLTTARIGQRNNPKSRKEPVITRKASIKTNGTGEYIHLLNYKDTRLHGLQNDNKKESLNTLIRNLEECDYYKRPQVTKYKDKTKATIESPW